MSNLNVLDQNSEGIEISKALTLIDPSKFLEGNSVDHEDLFIYATLKARVKNKSFVTQTEEEEISISFIKNKDTKISSINSEFLTTNWSEIGNKDTQFGTDLETFGIENIDISINAGFIPTVTIDFIDIRGATLFEQGSCSPYAAFFYQPYPIFELTVKGYYGYPIKYYLAIKSFTTSFDAASGNYKSKGEFIGYSYAFLSDILLGYIMAAPYMEGAKETLKEIYARYDALYEKNGYNKGGNPFNLGTMQQEPMTFYEYLKKIEELKSDKNGNNSVLTTIGNSVEFARLDDIGKLRDILENELNELIIGLKTETQSETNEENVTVIEYQSSEKNNNYYNDIVIPNLDVYVSNYNELVGQNFGNIKSEIEIVDIKGKIIKTETNGLTTVDFKDFNDYREKIIVKIIEVTKGLKEDFNKKSNEAIKGAIGFVPTIRSFFTVLIANTELFLELLRKASEDGENYHQSSEDKIKFNGKDDKKVSAVYYAWPTYNEEETVRPNSGSNFVERYPGIRFPLWPEVKFVDDFYLALETLNRELKEEGGEGLDLSALQDVPGRDNYMAINAMETPAGTLETANSYFNLQSLDEVYKTIGERFILMTNFTNLNEVNLNQSIVNKSQLALNQISDLNGIEHIQKFPVPREKTDSEKFTAIQPLQQRLSRDIPYYSFNLWYNPDKFNDEYLNGFSLDATNNARFLSPGKPLVNTKVSEDNTSAPANLPNAGRDDILTKNLLYLGEIEGHNIVDTFKEEPKMLQNIVNILKDPKKLKEKVLTSLGVTIVDTDLDRYYTSYRYNPTDNPTGGIILNPKKGEKKIFKPNIHDMDGDSLFSLQKSGLGTNTFATYEAKITDKSKVYRDIIDGSASSLGLNAFNRDFGIETLGELNTEELQNGDIPVYAPTAFYHLTNELSKTESETVPERIFNLEGNNILVTNLDEKKFYASNMLFNPWNGALTTINYGNDLSSSRKVEDGITLNKLSNFTSQNPITVTSRSVLEIYPDYLFPYDLDGYKERFDVNSVNRWGDLPFRHREDGAIELSGLGMYNRLPKPSSVAKKYGSKIGYWDKNDDAPIKQVGVQYSPFYTKPFNIDTEAEDNIKTLNNLIRLREIDGPFGDGVDYISVGLDSKLQYQGGFYDVTINSSDEYYSKVFEELVKINFINESDDGINGISGSLIRTWPGFIEDMTQFKNNFNTEYLAKPGDENNKLLWFVAYQPKYDPDTTAFRILTTSKDSTFEEFYNQTISENYTYKRWNSSTTVGEEWDEIQFHIIGGTIEPKYESDGITRKPLTLKIPQQLDFREFTEKNVKSGVVNNSLVKKLDSNFGLKNVGNQLNAGNTLIDSPFWRHNFPAPGLNSNIGKTNDTDNNTVYYSYWGGKYFLYKDKTNVGTHLPIGVRFDLDSWDNTSELIKDSGSFYTGRVNMLTQHNKDQFSLEAKGTTNFSYFGDTNHVYKSNYNRSKNWKGSLAYLWLANHYHRPWTGTYTNSSRFYGPLQTLGLASIVASIPKATLLLLGAVLWRMRESGLLISNKERWNLSPSDNAIKDNDGNYLDPINIPILPEEIVGIVNNKFNTKHFGWVDNSEVKDDINQGTFNWNNGVRPPMASLIGFGEFYQTGDGNYNRVVKDGGIVSCFPRADEWPTPNLGMTYVDDYFGRNKLENPFKNQYKIWTPFFQQMGALMQRFPNQSVIWFTREKQLKDFEEAIQKAVDYLQRYGEDFESSAQKEIQKEGDKAIKESSEEVKSIVENVGVLENFIKDNPNLSGADESYSKFTIIQHDLNSLTKRREKFDKNLNLENRVNQDYGRSNWSVLNKLDGNQTEQKIVYVTEEIELKTYQELYFLDRDKKFDGRNILKIEGQLPYTDDFVIDDFTATTTTQIEVAGQLQTFQTITSKNEQRTLEQRFPKIPASLFKGTNGFVINDYKPGQKTTTTVTTPSGTAQIETTSAGEYGYTYPNGATDVEKARLVRLMVEPKSGKQYFKDGLKFKVAFEDSNKSKTINNLKNLSLKRNDYIRGYIPIGPELWFLPTSVKNIIIKLFEDYVGDFNNFGGDANGTTGYDFDKVLAVIDPLNFPNPKDEVKKKNYQNVLKGDMTPYNLKSISETNNYKLPLIDRDSGASPNYPEALKRWERTYTNFEGDTPRPPSSSILTQRPSPNKSVPTERSLGGPITENIDTKAYFPTVFYIPKGGETTTPDTFKTIYLDEIKSEYVVANSTPRIWWGEYAVDSNNEETQQEYFYFNQAEIDKYIEGISNVLSTKKVENLTKKLFKSGLSSGLNNQDNDIKLALYRSLQSIYNKWISASSNSGDQKRLFYNPIGSGKDDDRLLIDHFSFVNRINADIGNKAVINLETTLTIKNNIENSIFGITSDILDTSNFAFHPLPAYVDLSSGLTDFSKKQNNNNSKLKNEIIRNMFIPQTSSESFSYASGPHYLCMYVGGNSKVLDFGKNQESESCLKLNGEKEEKKGDSGSLMDTIGSDSNGDPTEEATSPGVVGFKVKFGDQNQNHFIGVELDQAEYKNTNESLRAIEMISQAGQEGAAGGLVFKGQSLYEVFLNRSYSCTVEAFGNMMIQPLQYFELENVPMFYGSYLIRDVKHSIKPHNVKTSFTGDRIPQTTIPLVEDVIALYEIQRGEGEATNSLGGGSSSTFGGGSATGSYDLSNLETNEDTTEIIQFLQTSAVNENGETINQEFKLTDWENASLGSKGNWPNDGPEGIDLHWTAGYTKKSAFTTLKSKGLGYHIVLGEDGIAYRFSPLEQRASHAGCGEVYPNSDKPAGTCRSLNSKAIGISYVGGVESGRSKDGGKDVAYARTYEQWQTPQLSVPFCPNGTKIGSSGLFVCSDNNDFGSGKKGSGSNFNSKAQWKNLVNSILFVKAKYPKTIKYITSHYMHDGNKVDVGKDFPWNKLIEELKFGGWKDVKIISEWTAQDTGQLIEKDTLNATLDEYVLTNAELQEFSDNGGDGDLNTDGLGSSTQEVLSYSITDKDIWTLLAISARENYLESEQGMADVAQSILNRLGSGRYGANVNDTDAIAKIITADKQYEPTFTSNTNQTAAQVWRDIKDYNSAIKAVQYKKGDTNSLTEAQAKERLSAAYRGIKNNLIKSTSFIQGRTDFKSPEVYKIVDNKNVGNLSSGSIEKVKKEINEGTRPPFVHRGTEKNNVFGFANNYVDNITYVYRYPPWISIELNRIKNNFT